MRSQTAYVEIVPHTGMDSRTMLRYTYLTSTVLSLILGAALITRGRRLSGSALILLPLLLFFVGFVYTPIC
jgi:hypothetical protein